MCECVLYVLWPYFIFLVENLFLNEKLEQQTKACQYFDQSSLRESGSNNRCGGKIFLLQRTNEGGNTERFI